MIRTADDLRRRIYALGEGEPDPARITHALLNSLRDNELRVVVALTLHDYVRRTAKGAPSVQPIYETAAGEQAVSARVARIRDWVARELHRRVCLDEVEMTWKFLGDCTPSEVMAVAEIRRRKAAANLAEAEHYEALAKTAEHAGVDRIGELPRETLRKALAR